MTDDKKPKIVREDIELVKRWEQDEYENVLVYVLGKEKPLKISSKRKELADRLLAERAFKFCYANYMNKDYILDVQCMEQPSDALQSVSSPIKEESNSKPLTELKQPLKYGRDENKVDFRTAIMEVGQDWRSGRREVTDPLVIQRELWLMENLGVKEAPPSVKSLPKSEPINPKEIPPEELKEALEQSHWTLKDARDCLVSVYKLPTESKVYPMFQKLPLDKQVEFVAYVKKNPLRII